MHVIYLPPYFWMLLWGGGGKFAAKQVTFVSRNDSMHIVLKKSVSNDIIRLKKKKDCFSGHF